VLWVVGLGIGMLGFESLPGVSLIKGSHAVSPPTPAENVPAVDDAPARAQAVKIRTPAGASPRAPIAGRPLRHSHKRTTPRRRLPPPR
jgi:hypothetical protein